MFLLLKFSAKYGVGRKAIHPCTGFCGVMGLLIALSYERGNRFWMSPFFRSKKKMFILPRDNHVSLSASRDTVFIS